jgi:hypothetical protein
MLEAFDHNVKLFRLQIVFPNYGKTWLFMFFVFILEILGLPLGHSGFKHQDPGAVLGWVNACLDTMCHHFW